MKIAIGADHRGFAHKEFIKQEIEHIEWVDVGAFDEKRSDYPVFARALVDLIQKGDVTCGVLICGSGVGIAMAANRFSHIYAGVVWNEQTARVAKEHDNINILVIPSDFVTESNAAHYIEIWLKATFKEERYRSRLEMIDGKK